MWFYRTPKCAKNQALIFEYQPNRSAENPQKFLKDFKGCLQSDGYSGYHCLENILNVGCWAHLRRKFNDCVKTLSNKLKNKSLAAIGLNFCNKIFYLEKYFEKVDFKERFEQRNLYLKPLTEKFFEWAKSEYAAESSSEKSLSALGYAISQEKYLINIFFDGRLEISNNLAKILSVPLFSDEKIGCFVTL